MLPNCFVVFFTKKTFHQKTQTQIGMKLKNSSCDELNNSNCNANLYTQIVMKLKNSNCDDTQKNQSVKKIEKLKFWPNLKTQMVI